MTKEDDKHNKPEKTQEECHEDYVRARLHDMKTYFIQAVKDPEIISAIKNKIVDPVVNYQRDELNHRMRFYILSFIAGVFSILFAWDSSMSQVTIDKAEKDIKVYTALVQKISGSVLAIRNQNEYVIISKEHGKDVSPYEIELKNYQSLNELQIIMSGVNEISDTDIKNSLRLLSAVDQSFIIFSDENPLPLAYALRAYTERTTRLINLKIAEKHKEIERAQQFIVVRMIDDFKHLFQQN